MLGCPIVLGRAGLIVGVVHPSPLKLLGIAVGIAWYLVVGALSGLCGLCGSTISVPLPSYGTHTRNAFDMLASY